LDKWVTLKRRENLVKMSHLENTITTGNKAYTWKNGSPLGKSVTLGRKESHFVTIPHDKGGCPRTHKINIPIHTRENTLQLDIRLQVFNKTITLTNKKSDNTIN